MDLSIFFAGTGGSLPSPQRGLPATLIRRGGEKILFDCGEGTQRQLLRSIGLTEIDEIFITHLHADHWLGLPGLLKTFDMRSREHPLTVHGPLGIRDLVDTLLRYAGRTAYPLYVVELEPGEIVEHDGYEISAVGVAHRGRCLGYVLEEQDRPGVFDPVAATAAGLVPGPEFGRVQRGETIRGIGPDQVMGPVRAGRKLTISGDTRPSAALTEAAHRSDVLIHEATFSIADAERAHETGHSTATQAAGVAREAEVGLLALYHFSIRYPVRVLHDEAREIFANTVAPRDFDTIEMPFPEHGQPALVRFSGRNPRATRSEGGGRDPEATPPGGRSPAAAPRDGRARC